MPRKNARPAAKKAREKIKAEKPKERRTIILTYHGPGRMAALGLLLSTMLGPEKDGGKSDE